jgi:L-seryl-tRNA(Ser) seleniumtransferase
MPHEQKRLLPSMTQLLQTPEVEQLLEQHGRQLVQPALRDAVEDVRAEIQQGSQPMTRGELLEHVIFRASARLDELDAFSVRRVINGSGILLHTGLGRAPLSQHAMAAIAEAAGASLVEVDPETGERVYRGFQVARQLQVLTSAADSVIVNNNAGATLLVLSALCHGKEVLISRGQLVEIGGSFRLPEIFACAGVQLREVGTTNRTHLRDYEAAVTDQTAAILRVHASNYRIEGFTSEPSTAELATITQNHKLLLMDDIGSGQPRSLPLIRQFAEPDFESSISAGADIVLGSGDKLLGGPQCGIIVGRSELIGQLQRHPLARCLRVDKFTLAALQATLDQHLTEDHPDIPLLNMLRATVESLQHRGQRIVNAVPTDLATSQLISTAAEVGGGTCAGYTVESQAVQVRPVEGTAEALARTLRMGRPAVWPRTQGDAVLIDLRSLQPADDNDLIDALREALNKATDQQ